MSHRKLTEGCLVAMRAVGAEGCHIYNRTIANNLRIVEKFFPEFIKITPPPHCDHIGARPVFGAMLTPAGLAFITPRKITRRNLRAEAHHEARA